MTRPILGDPLTGSLPVTRLISPVRATIKPARLDWPLVADPDPVKAIDLGNIVKVRTRFGVRELRVRLVLRSRGRRRYLIGQTRKGWLRHAWLSNVISVQPWTGR